MKQKTKLPFYVTPSGKTIKVYTPDGYVGYRLSSIERSLQRVTTKSIELTKKYGGNAKFPEDLGANEYAPLFVREAVDIINDVVDGVVETRNGYRYSAQDVNESIQLIRQSDRNKETFDNQFYGYVRDYYNAPTLTNEQTKAALEAKQFLVPWADVENVQYDSEREYKAMKAWIVDEIQNVSAKSLENASYAQLKYIMEQYKLFGLQGVPKEFTQRYARSKASRRIRNRLGIKPRGGKK